MDWKTFLKVALQNLTYAKQLLGVFPLISPVVRSALEVIIDHAATHSDCIVELADKLSQVLRFGDVEEAYSAALSPIAEEITLVRTKMTDMGLFNAEFEPPTED